MEGIRRRKVGEKIKGESDFIKQRLFFVFWNLSTVCMCVYESHLSIKLGF